MTIIEKSISVGASRETVWRYLEDPDLLAGWLMRNNFSGRVGDDSQFFARPAGDWDGVLNCRLVTFDPPFELAFTWDANDIRCETLVTIELLEEAGGTRAGRTPFSVPHRGITDYRYRWTPNRVCPRSDTAPGPERGRPGHEQPRRPARISEAGGPCRDNQDTHRYA